MVLLVGSTVLVGGCFEDDPPATANQNLAPSPGGAECYFDCSQWDTSTFGPSARAPAVIRRALAEGAYVGAPGRKVGEVCVPEALPDRVKEFVTSAPPRPAPMRDQGGTNADTDVESKGSLAGSLDTITASFRYACIADGYLLAKDQTRTPDEKDIQSFFEEECIAAGACPSFNPRSDQDMARAPERPGRPTDPTGKPTDHEKRDSCAGKADGVYCSELNTWSAYVCEGQQIAAGQHCEQTSRCIGPNGPGNDVQCAAPSDDGQGFGDFDRDFINHYIDASKRQSGGIRVRDWDPNDAAPRNWLGRRVVAHITEGPCRAFNAFDQMIRQVNNQWGLYASYGASGGAGGALKLSAAYAYDQTNYESAAYMDAGVNIGFNASIGLSAARGITIGGASSNYGSIHDFFGGAYVGANGNVATPFARVGVGMQISTCMPSVHPWTLELSVSFGIGATPFEANATTGAILPVNVGTRTLRGITQGWINVFDDEYGSVAFGGIGNQFGGNYERMRNSPGSSDIWKAGSQANSAVRFASAPDLAAFFLLRAAFEYAWRGMRAVCN